MQFPMVWWCLAEILRSPPTIGEELYKFCALAVVVDSGATEKLINYLSSAAGSDRKATDSSKPKSTDGHPEHGTGRRLAPAMLH
jgi:hypothetical protein